jgi:hypothetical protein
MNWLQAIWNWLNGNKTIIGLVIAFLLSKTWFTAWVGPEVADIISWISATFIVGGVAHKVIKSNTEPGPNG